MTVVSAVLDEDIDQLPPDSAMAARTVSRRRLGLM